MTITSNTPLPRIAFLGTGIMGLPMATRLCKAGYTLQVWNRTPGKAGPLTALGATAHTQASAAVAAADIVISMLESGPIVDGVLFAQR
ncbi:MAG: NAD(P)-binding domain-containing protein, partial [Inhella sp.]|uniref:NAD(P)-binding domain-containing protein n=1 Tax=Inhella sp. TaxID=1921806 RepID=UPI0022CAAC3E